MALMAFGVKELRLSLYSHVRGHVMQQLVYELVICVASII